MSCVLEWATKAAPIDKKLLPVKLENENVDSGRVLKLEDGNGD